MSVVMLIVRRIQVELRNCSHITEFVEKPLLIRVKAVQVPIGQRKSLPEDALPEGNGEMYAADHFVISVSSMKVVVVRRRPV